MRLRWQGTSVRARRYALIGISTFLDSEAASRRFIIHGIEGFIEALVANEIKASIDTWDQKSLSDLQADMCQRLQVQFDAFQQNIAQRKQSIATVDGQIAMIMAGLDNLAAANLALATDIVALQKRTEDTRKAMQAAVNQWELNGKDAVATAVSIAKTVAMFA